MTDRIQAVLRRDSPHPSNQLPDTDAIGVGIKRVAIDIGDRARLIGLSNRVAADSASRIGERRRNALADEYGLERGEIDRLLGLLTQAARYSNLQRSRYDRGRRTRERCRGFTLRAPRAWFLRAPASADTHRHGAVDDVDPYGSVYCSQTLRSAHLLLPAIVGGMVKDHEHVVDERTIRIATREACYLLYGSATPWGADLERTRQVFSDLEGAEIRADVEDGYDPSYSVPCSPIEHVEVETADTKRISLSEYRRLRPAGKAPALASPETLRVVLASWFWRELHARPVYASAEVARQQWPFGCRLYLYVAARGGEEDGKRACYFSDPLRVTFGCERTRRSDLAEMLAHAGACIQQADERCATFELYTHGPSGEPAIAVLLRPREHSRPKQGAQAGTAKVPARRPSCERSKRWSRARPVRVVSQAAPAAQTPAFNQDDPERIAEVIGDLRERLGVAARGP